MVQPIRLARNVAFCTLVAALLTWGGFTLAGTYNSSPYHCGNVCIPNAKYFGHFQTTWRRWPGKVQQDVAFPQSISAEEIRTPTPQKQQAPPQAPTSPGPGGGFNPGLLPGLPPAGGILPPLEGASPFDEMAPPAVPAMPQLPGSQIPVAPFEPGNTLDTPAVPSLPSAVPSLPSAVPPAIPSGPAEPPTLPADPLEPSPLEPPAVEPVSPSTSSDQMRLPKLIEQTALEEPQPVPVQPAPVQPAPVQPDDAVAALREPMPVPFSSQPQPQIVPEQIAPKQIAEESLSMPELRPLVGEPRLVAPKPVGQPIAGAAAGVQEPTAVAAAEDATPRRTKVKPLQANWMAALHPGFRGDAGRTVSKYPSRPTRQVAHEAMAESARTPGTAKGELPRIHGQPAGQIESTRHIESPPIALDGFCPVNLVQHERWVAGDPGRTVVHQGRTYMFSGDGQRQRFLADPARYTPRFSGHDPVLAVDGQRRVLGQTDYCVTYEGRLYMFSSSVTLARFRQNPQRYAAAASE